LKKFGWFYDKTCLQAIRYTNDVTEAKPFYLFIKLNDTRVSNYS